MRIVFVGCWAVLTFAVWQSVAQSAVTSRASHFQFREPHAAGYHVEIAAPPNASLKATGSAQWLNAWSDNGSTNYLQFGRRVVLRLTAPEDLAAVLQGRQVRLDRTISEHVFILEASDVLTALREAQSLAEDPRVTACYPVTRRPKQLHAPYAPRPNDPFFFKSDKPQGDWQANLENRDADGAPLGIDLNVRAAWPITRGEGVVLALADDGFDLHHPDLEARAHGAPHFNFIFSTTNGMPSGEFSDHATAVAGLAAATADNRIGIAGVAPKARLASWVIFGASDQLVSEEALMDMFQHRSNIVDVQNHSWGKVGAEQLRLSMLEDLALSNAVQFGRAGRGVVIVRAAGNGRGEGNDANDDGYASDPRVIAVAAARLDGRAARYSSPGACILVAAPSGDMGDATDPCMSDSPNLTTTDRQGSLGYNRTLPEDSGDYAYGDTGFSGTSASTPQIAGLAALILAANTNLTYRDVQQILVLSSRLIDFADPTLSTNGAGLRVSHNLGFGIPDAGMAVSLARTWANRPPAAMAIHTLTNRAAIPDLGLRIRVQGGDVPENLSAIIALPGAGPHPDHQTDWLPLVDVGSATDAIDVDLRGKAALIQRGINYFCEKVHFAALAGAELAVVYNNRDEDTRIQMAETDLTTIPSVFISQNDGQALRDFVAGAPGTRVRWCLESTNYTFNVDETLQCEFVGVRLDTDHTARGDLRIVLTSPAGTPSVLQRVNQDMVPGPTDWVYYSVQHFYESSYGSWTLSVADEDEKGSGVVRSASLMIIGVPLKDADHDGLEDSWELTHFKTLDHGPADDPDQDGSSNAREQILRTPPLGLDAPLQLDLSVWDSRLARLSWASNSNTLYRVQIGPESVAPLTLITNMPGRFGETEWFVPYTNVLHQFFQVQAVKVTN